jgi:phosphatidylglycerophosphate synthase
MADPSLPSLLIIADSPDALTKLGGISLLERLRRIARQMGFRDAVVLSNSIESVTQHMAQQSWHAKDVSLTFREFVAPKIAVGDILDALATRRATSENRALIIWSNFYCDERLVRALVDARHDCALIDSDPPRVTKPLWENSEYRSGAAVLSHDCISGKNRNSSLMSELAADLTAGRMAALDAALQPSYLPDMRRSIRPIFFPAPTAQHRPLAERLLRDATQKGVLDLPALVHAPIEKWIVSFLCRTSITPNQVTLVTGILGAAVTVLYVLGYLWPGALLALAVGILDGVDGKLARLKIQTTKAGKGEHALDYIVEMSWWAGLAYHFHVTGQVTYAYATLLIFFAFDLLQRIAKWSVEQRLRRRLDDVSRFDRRLRYVAGRRNIYTWLFTFCLLIGLPPTGFVLLCSWGIVTAATHIIRAVQIRSSA